MGLEATKFSPVAPPAARRRPTGILQILKDASILSTRGWKSMLTAVFVAFALLSLLLLGARFSTSPLMGLALDLYQLHSQDPAAHHRFELVAAAEKDAKTATTKELIFLSISFLTSWISSMAAFYVHDAASTVGKQSASERTGTGGGIHGALVTLLCIAGLTVGYAFFLETMVLVLLAVADGSAWFVALGLLLSSVARLLSFSAGMFWGQGLAISMLDDQGCCGMEALRKPVQVLIGSQASQPEHLPV